MKLLQDFDVKCVIQTWLNQEWFGFLRRSPYHLQTEETEYPGWPRFKHRHGESLEGRTKERTLMAFCNSVGMMTKSCSTGWWRELSLEIKRFLLNIFGLMDPSSMIIIFARSSFASTKWTASNCAFLRIDHFGLVNNSRRRVPHCLPVRPCRRTPPGCFVWKVPYNQNFMASHYRRASMPLSRRVMSLSMRIFPDLAASNNHMQHLHTKWSVHSWHLSLIVGISVNHIKLEELLAFLIGGPVDEVLAAKSALGEGARVIKGA